MAKADGVFLVRTSRSDGGAVRFPKQFAADVRRVYGGSITERRAMGQQSASSPEKSKQSKQGHG